MEPYSIYAFQSSLPKDYYNGPNAVNLSCFHAFATDWYSWGGCEQHKTAFLIRPCDIRANLTNCPMCTGRVEDRVACRQWYEKLYASRLYLYLKDSPYYIMPHEDTSKEALDAILESYEAERPRRARAHNYFLGRDDEMVVSKRKYTPVKNLTKSIGDIAGHRLDFEDPDVLYGSEPEYDAEEEVSAKRISFAVNLARSYASMA